MKIAMISEDSIPVIYNALCYWNAQMLQFTGIPDVEALQVIEAIEREFPQLFKEGKVTYTP